MFTVYKITNNINKKTYIGVHKTDNLYDNYMGSGKAIKAAMVKHGIDNFSKDILFITENKNEAYALEKELTVDYYKETNYNMKQGGVGGFTKENSRKGIIALAKIGGKAAYEQKKGYHSQTKQQLSENGRKGGLANKGKSKTEEHKQRLRDTWAKKKMD